MVKFFTKMVRFPPNWCNFHQIGAILYHNVKIVRDAGDLPDLRQVFSEKN
jgi:hypothetical protein